MRLVITLDAERVQLLGRLFIECNRSESSSHGALTLEQLAQDAQVAPEVFLKTAQG